MVWFVSWKNVDDIIVPKVTDITISIKKLSNLKYHGASKNVWPFIMRFCLFLLVDKITMTGTITIIINGSKENRGFAFTLPFETCNKTTILFIISKLN